MRLDEKKRRMMLAVLIASQAAGDSNYDPFNDYAAVTAWYSHKDQSTLFQDSAGTTPAGTGDVVGRWADKSGNGYHQLQATTTRKFTNTANGLLADGADDYMVAEFGTTIAQPNTIFFVGGFVSAPGGASRFFFDGTTNRHAIFNNGGTSSYAIFSGATLSSATTPTLTGNVFSAVYNGSSSQLRFSGSQIASGNAGTSGLSGLTLASASAIGNYAHMLISELIVIPEAAPLAKIQATEAALAAQYGITL